MKYFIFMNIDSVAFCALFSFKEAQDPFMIL